MRRAERPRRRIALLHLAVLPPASGAPRAPGVVRGPRAGEISDIFRPLRTSGPGHRCRGAAAPLPAPAGGPEARRSGRGRARPGRAQLGRSGPQRERKAQRGRGREQERTQRGVVTAGGLDPGGESPNRPDTAQRQQPGTTAHTKAKAPQHQHSGKRNRQPPPQDQPQAKPRKREPNDPQKRAHRAQPHTADPAGAKSTPQRQQTRAAPGQKTPGETDGDGATRRGRTPGGHQKPGAAIHCEKRLALSANSGPQTRCASPRPAPQGPRHRPLGSPCMAGASPPCDRSSTRARKRPGLPLPFPARSLSDVGASRPRQRGPGIRGDSRRDPRRIVTPGEARRDSPPRQQLRKPTSSTPASPCSVRAAPTRGAGPYISTPAQNAARPIPGARRHDERRRRRLWEGRLPVEGFGHGHVDPSRVDASEHAGRPWARHILAGAAAWAVMQGLVALLA